jgi:TetR/AcrR family transcriptional regulator, mexJK operon transcriptional repressor
LEVGLSLASEEKGSRAWAKREQILAGAQLVFLRDGFAGASTDAIAAEARVSKRTLYSYYSGKEELFAGVLRRLTIDNHDMQVLAIFEEPEPEDFGELRKMLVGLAGRVASIMMDPDYLALLRTIIADTHRFPQLGEIYRSTVPERGFRIFLGLMERVRERGIVDIPDAEAATRLFFGPLVTYALLDGLFKPGEQPQPPAPEKIEHIVEMYMKAIA